MRNHSAKYLSQIFRIMVRSYLLYKPYLTVIGHVSGLPGLGFPTRYGFLVSSGFLGIFWLNLTKSGFLRHCSFSPHFITSSLTTVNLMTLKLQLR